MKKRNIINLIKYYSEHNDLAFRNEAYVIAQEFDKAGDTQIAQYIMALMSGTHLFSPQKQVAIDNFSSHFFQKISIDNEPLPLPEAINDDILGIINVITKNRGLHKFLFQGPPGTGKTESIKQISRILNKQLYSVNFSSLIDSKLGQTQKNVVEIFSEMNSTSPMSTYIFLFDEVDTIALDRTNEQDIREMGRVTSTILKELDNLSESVILFATTNLYKHLEKALIRRFDLVVDFGRYNNEDLTNIALKILDYYLTKFKFSRRNNAMFKKILEVSKPLPMPGELKNKIKVSLAFSSRADSLDYMKELYKHFTGRFPTDIEELSKEKFTVREIEILTNISKSQVARDLKGGI